MKQLRQILKSKQGMTLVEEIMASVLTLILLTAITVLLSSCIRIYGDVKATAYAQEVGEIVLDKVAGELTGAQSAGGVILSSDGGTAAFSNRTGSPLYISLTAADAAGEQFLLVHYRPVKNAGQEVYQAVDWTFDRGMYMGYAVQSLRFAHVRDNLLSVTLTLERGSYTYTAYRYVECYNLSAAGIQTGTVPED